jgi:flagellar motility protein MotE (MotC chaperone)
MKPKDAARIFEKLDMETLLLVAERMKERKLAPIMAKMDPTKAKDITEELAQLRQVLPASAPPAKQSGRG